MKKNIYFHIIQIQAVIFFISCTATINAQNFNFSYFNVPEGLSQSSVRAIYNDSRGYLWVATSGGGVAQFDGKNFINYSERNGLAGNIVTGIAEDKDGNMWFTSTWGGISKFNGKKMITLTKNDGLENNANTSIYIDKNNKIWLGSENGISIYENGFFINATNKHLRTSVNFIKADNNENIWVCTDNGIVMISEKDTLLFTTENNLPSNHVSAIAVDHLGNHYIGFSDKGIYKIISGSLVKDALLELEPVVTDINISSIVIDNDKNTWFSSKNEGIFYINTKQEITHISKNNGLETKNINSLYKDRKGNLWIGSDGAGLIKFNAVAFSYFDNVEGLNKNNVFGILTDDEGNVWVVTSDGGAYKYDGKQSIQYTQKNGLGSNTIRAVVKDKNGTLWFATNNGLTKYSKGVFKNYTTADGLPSNIIKSLIIDKKGNIWAGTNGGGLVSYNHTNFKVFNQKSGLSHNYVHSLFEDAKGNIWAGTGNGINKIVGENVISYSTSNLCNTYVSSITEDNFGNIWFGTDRCLTKYDGIDFKSFTLKEGLSSDVIYLVHYSSRGDLWIGTNNGLDKISFNSYGQIDEIKNYGYNDGFKGIECNSRAVYEDEKGSLWFGTIKGVIKYTPSTDRENVFESKTYITDVKLFFETVNWLSYTSKLAEWNNLPASVTLPYDKNHFTFEFNAINLTQPKGILYSFMLEGFDKNWGPATNKDYVTYSNLPPGKYTFKVKAKNNHGVWNQTPTAFSFTIKPPFWHTWWFYLVVAILTFYTILKIASFKEKKQLEISKELEEKVKERTYVIEKQRDEKEILLKEIHHRVKNNMQVINSLLSIQSNYTKDETALALFDEAKNRIRSMALIHEKMYQSNDLSHIDFKDYISALTNDLLSTYSLNKEIKLDLQIEHLKFGIDTSIPIGLLLNEIISNSLKYAFTNEQTGTIFIQIFALTDKKYELIVGDDGVGMPLGTLIKGDETLGMELIKVFVSQLDGEITRMDKKGTFFKIIFHNLDKR